MIALGEPESHPRLRLRLAGPARASAPMHGFFRGRGIGASKKSA
jgi:hypothetical protein